MKTLALLALVFAAGCTDSYLTGTTEWRVQLGSYDDPICSGTMILDWSDPTQDMQFGTYDGSWDCAPYYGGVAHADLRDDGTMFLDLERYPGAFSGVRATYTGGDSRQIIGEMSITQLVPFAAYLK
jgi:hypothetical protein